MPVSVIEARAFGLPVVSTEVGGLPYLIQDGLDGFLVPDNDHEAMAAKIQRLFDDSSLARDMSRRGREIAERSGWRRVRPKWEKLLTELSREKRARDLKFGAIDQC
jgi:glycosyltransferase involved in cell wall biosynthesis